MQVLYLARLRVFDRLLAHLLVLGVLQLLVALLVDDFDLASDLHQPHILLTGVFLAGRQGEERLRPLLGELLLIDVVANARK